MEGYRHLDIDIVWTEKEKTLDLLPSTCTLSLSRFSLFGGSRKPPENFAKLHVEIQGRENFTEKRRESEMERWKCFCFGC